MTNNELLVYKSKYQGDKRYSYSGSEFPFSYNEKQKIRNVEHVTHVDERIDIDSHIQVIGDVIKMKGDISSLTLFENKLSQSIKDIAYLTTSYQPSSLKKKDILKEFQTNGVYINQQLYEQFPKLKESQSPNLTFYLNIPYANVDNVMEESVGNTDKMVKTNATGCIRIRTTLPVKGVIKSTSRFNYLQSLQETVYIDVKTYKKYVDKYRLQKPKIYYQYSKDNSYVEGYDIKREDLIKKGYKIEQNTLSPWQATCLSVLVDKAQNIDYVKSQFIDMGYNIVNENQDISNFPILTKDNKYMLMTFFILLTIFISGFYFYLKYLHVNEEKEMRFYLKNLGISFKNQNYIIHKKYIQNLLILFLLTSILYRLLIEIIVKYNIVELIMPPNLFHFILFLFISLIIELIMPEMIIKGKKVYYDHFKKY